MLAWHCKRGSFDIRCIFWTAVCSEKSFSHSFWGCCLCEPARWRCGWKIRPWYLCRFLGMVCRCCSDRLWRPWENRIHSDMDAAYLGGISSGGSGLFRDTLEIWVDGERNRVTAAISVLKFIEDFKKHSVVENVPTPDVPGFPQVYAYVCAGWPSFCNVVTEDKLIELIA